MIFLVRKIRTMPELRRFKIVAVTDRTDLEEQLAASARPPARRPPRRTQGRSRPPSG